MIIIGFSAAAYLSAWLTAVGGAGITLLLRPNFYQALVKVCATSVRTQ